MTNTPTPLHAHLSKLLAQTPGLLWLSDGECPVEVVRVDPCELGIFTRSFNADLLLGAQVQMNRDFLPLVCGFDGHDLQAFTLPNGKPSESELLILCRDGDGFTGLKMGSVAQT
ncbi:hypothetical protein [Spirosoma luteum]|uniref:hypothetical protein n=1 Tax=Spirosoma luteum TaxID=431553 RepID=UPI0003725420|nr:hypothetical protein [Spirosoma luteum]